MESWAMAANVATVVQAVLLPVSLGLVAYQLWVQARFTRAANTQALVELSSPFNLLLIQDHEFAKMWVKGPKKFDRMDKVTRYRFQSLVIWWMIFHENIFYQHRLKLIDEPTYRAWDSDLRLFVRKLDLRKHWPEFRIMCQRDFVEYVDSLASGPATDR